MTKAVFSLAMSLMVMSSDLRALSLNMYWQPYRSGRSKTWLKTKCFTQSTFVVIGTDRDRKTGALRALLAHKDSAGLSYAGAAFIALAGDERTRFFAELERLATSWAAFKLSRLTDVKWCHPKLTVEVKHLAGSKMLRHATVKRLSS
jgi:bifunctional non-homologous end joining protein LigD